MNSEQIKTGEFLTIILAILVAVGAAAGGAIAVANSVISAKQKEEEAQRHNIEMKKIAQKAKAINVGSSLKKQRK